MPKIVHSNSILTVNDLHIDKTFGSMHQSIATKMLAKIGLLKQLWAIVLGFLGVHMDGNNSKDKMR